MSGASTPIPGFALAFGLAFAGASLAGCAQLIGGMASSKQTAFEPGDQDEDGYGDDVDCDDSDPDVFPNAEDTPGDGIDSNCDGDDDT